MIQSRGDHHRNVCIIPVSAHGTNPASAAMCGMKIITVGTDAKGNINMEEVRKAAEDNKDSLAALMVTYPSTHGVYEETIDEICKIIHDNGGQVYMDGANMNAQVRGLDKNIKQRSLGICLNLLLLGFVVGWFDQPWFHWSGCVPSQSPQDLLYSSWRWWAWNGSHWCEEAFSTISSFSPCG